jgi:peptide/nickel transport system permease protein
VTAGLLVGNLWANVPAVAITSLFAWLFLRSRREPLWAEAYRRLRRNRLALAAVVTLGLYGGVVFLDSVSWQSSSIEEPRTVVDRLFDRPFEKTYSEPMATTTAGELTPHRLRGWHVFGTDSVGKDVFYKVLKGFRTAFVIGGLACLVAVPIAITLGLSAGYFGGLWDDIIQYVYTVSGSIPDILLIVALVLMLGKGLSSICLAMGLTSWVGLCRLIRGETLKHRDREYVRAARALGAGPVRILVIHILPNLLPAIIISVTLLFSSLALYETVLAYLGVGVGSNLGSWGNMIDSARDELTRDPSVWWNLVFASGALLVMVLSLNVLADALRDAIDPRLRTE